MTLSDQSDIYWIFIGCIHWSAWQSIQYYLGDTVGSAGYPLNIHCVYPLISLTVHLILSGWYLWMHRIPTEYSLGVSICYPDSPSTIVLEQPDTQQMFIGRIYSSPSQSIQYCPDKTVGSARYPLNVYRVYLLVNPTGNPILSGWYHRISRILTEYFLTKHLNIVWMVESD